MFEAKLVQDSENELKFTLQLKDTKLEKDAAVRVQLVNADKFFMPSYSGFCILPVKETALQDTLEKSCHQVTFTLPQILDECGATNLNSRVFEFVLINGNAEEFIACGGGFKDIEIKSALISYRMCLGKGKNLVLRLKWKVPLMEGKMELQEYSLLVELSAKRKGSLVLRHRIEHKILSFDRAVNYTEFEQNKYRIEYKDFINQVSTNKDLFSLFYLSPATETTPAFYYRIITNEVFGKKQCGSYVITPCKTKDKTASIDVCRVFEKAVVSDVRISDNKITFSLSEKKPSNLKLNRVIKVPDDDKETTYEFVQLSTSVSEGNTIDLMKWNEIHQNETLVYQLLAEVDGEEFLITSGKAYEKTLELPHQTVVLKGNSKEFTLSISEKANKIKLGIMGTCMTRWAFSSKYTVAYRPLYDVAFAHFWPSAFSLTEELIDYPKEKYKNYPEKEKPFVLREYQKTSFKELKDAKCDYVLVDFFVDAIHGPRKLKDGKFIGYKAYSNDFYQDYLMFDSERFFIDENDYFEQWTKAADRMIEALLTIVPQNKIVLATGGLTHHFLSEDGKIECFDGMVLRNSYMTKHSINALNYLWDKMNTYFMTKLPGAHVLSMREYGFPAHDRNPDNVRPYHFKNSYYRAMSAELSRIILWDRQNR